MRFEEQNNETKITTMLDKIYKKLAGDEAEVDTDLATYPNDVKVPLLLEKIYEVIDNSGEGGGSIDAIMPTFEFPTTEGAAIPQSALDAIFIPVESPPQGAYGPQLIKEYPPFLRVKCTLRYSGGKADAVLSIANGGHEFIYTSAGSVAGSSGQDKPFRVVYTRKQGLSLEFNVGSTTDPNSNYDYRYEEESDSYVLRAPNS